MATDKEKAQALFIAAYMQYREHGKIDDVLAEQMINLSDAVELVDKLQEREPVKALTDRDYPPIGKYAKDGDNPKPLYLVPNHYLGWCLRQQWISEKYPEFWMYLKRFEDVILRK